MSSSKLNTAASETRKAPLTSPIGSPLKDDRSAEYRETRLRCLEAACRLAQVGRWSDINQRACGAIAVAEIFHHWLNNDAAPRSPTPTGAGETR